MNIALECTGGEFLLLFLQRASEHPLAERRSRGICFVAFQGRQNIQIVPQPKEKGHFLNTK